MPHLSLLKRTGFRRSGFDPDGGLVRVHLVATGNPWFGVAPPCAPLPANISLLNNNVVITNENRSMAPRLNPNTTVIPFSILYLTNDGWFICPSPSLQGKATACLLHPKVQMPNQKGARTGGKFFPRQNGDLTIMYYVIQAISVTNFAQKTNALLGLEEG
ncbi:hypothetical protein Dimus_028508 [Dionaea muscipula]